MRITRIFKSLGPIDLRNVRRDSLLAWVIALPLSIVLIIRLGAPPLAEVLWQRFQFDMTPYYPLALSGLIILFPLVIGMVIGFLLLDERDDGTLTALQVTPLTLGSYLAYRVSVPTLLTAVLMIGILPIANLGGLRLFSLLVVSLVAAPLAPLFALTLAALAANKVQGFAVVKALGGVLTMLPIVGYFVRPPWHWAFGLLPSFWPMRVYWGMAAGERPVWLYALIGLVYQALLLAVLLRRFNQVIHR